MLPLAIGRHCPPCPTIPPSPSGTPPSSGLPPILTNCCPNGIPQSLRVDVMFTDPSCSCIINPGVATYDSASNIWIWHVGTCSIAFYGALRCGGITPLDFSLQFDNNVTLWMPFSAICSPFDLEYSIPAVNICSVAALGNVSVRIRG